VRACNREPEQIARSALLIGSCSPDCRGQGSPHRAAISSQTDLTDRPVWSAATRINTTAASKAWKV